MTQRDRVVAVLHMRDHAEEAVALAKSRTREDLETDRVFELALTRLVEIIGEAAGRVATEIQEAHPEIPWRQIVGTRHRLIHAYDAVDHDILWRIVSAELPELIEMLRSVLAEDHHTQS